MMPLSRERCEACRRDSPQVTDAEQATLHPMVAEWDLTKRDGINCLNRTFEVNDFFQAMAFAFKIGKEAENEGHHPQITFEWGRVHVAWWTHKIKGLHRNDFIMAAKTDEIFTTLQQSNFL